MNGTRYYANVPDLSQIPQALLSLVMHDWFDKRDVVFDTKKVDGSYVQVIGNSTGQIEARTEMLKLQRGVRNGGGVRIKEVSK